MPRLGRCCFAHSPQRATGAGAPARRGQLDRARTGHVRRGYPRLETSPAAAALRELPVAAAEAVGERRDGVASRDEVCDGARRPQGRIGEAGLSWLDRPAPPCILLVSLELPELAAHLRVGWRARARPGCLFARGAASC